MVTISMEKYMNDLPDSLEDRPNQNFQNKNDKLQYVLC